MLRLDVIAVVCLFAPACARQAPWYPPPEQRKLQSFQDPGDLHSFVKMHSPLAIEHIVRDIDPNLAQWRWAMAAPRLSFRVPGGKRLKFVADLFIAERTFAETGPVTVTCTVNGSTLGAVRCDRPGEQRVEYAVPPGWLKAGSKAMVDLVADKLWTAPTDGARLSFLISAAGFVE